MRSIGGDDLRYAGDLGVVEYARGCLGNLKGAKALAACVEGLDLGAKRTFCGDIELLTGLGRYCDLDLAAAQIFKEDAGGTRGERSSWSPRSGA